MDLTKKFYKDKMHSYYLTKVPNNELDLKIIVIDLFQKELIPMPIDSLHIYRIIKKKLRNFENSVYLLSRLDINQVIISLIDEGCFLYEEIIITFRKCFFIKAVVHEKLENFAQKLKGIAQSEPLDEEKMRFVILETLNNKKERENILKSRLIKEAKIKPLIGSSSINNFDFEVLNYNTHLNYYSSNNTNKSQTYNIDSLLGVSGNILARSKQLQISNEKRNAELEQEDQEIMNSIFYQPSAKMLLSQNDEEFLENKDKNISTYTSFYIKYKSSLKPFCQYGTRPDCYKKNKKANKCDLIHFKPVIRPHTDVSLGDCSYLDTCRHMDICKFVHYEIEETDTITSNRKELVLSSSSGSLPSQWINCDIRFFDLKILGKFEVVMADPPWDIHMDLPYGTLTDEEMKAIKVQELQTDGIIFLWVTGRATELARECLDLWGYERKEELVWIKTNQLQRLIRTGRTGHWLNHSKEHCLIGIKGNPKLNRNVDCDVLVSEVRETSRKPDEIYELIERLCPGGRKIELFARPHNRRYGWVSLGNQLPGAYIVEDDVIERFNQSYPNESLSKEDMETNRMKSIETKKKIDN